MEMGLWPENSDHHRADEHDADGMAVGLWSENSNADHELQHAPSGIAMGLWHSKIAPRHTIGKAGFSANGASPYQSRPTA